MTRLELERRIENLPVALTPQQERVLLYACLGYKAGETAVEMELSFHTVHEHMRSIRQRLEVASKAKAVALVMGLS